MTARHHSLDWRQRERGMNQSGLGVGKRKCSMSNQCSVLVQRVKCIEANKQQQTPKVQRLVAPAVM